MMRVVQISWFLTLLFGTYCMGQPADLPDKSPKKMVEEFWKMESQGGRLTDAGWAKADSFFLRPVESPTPKKIGVIKNGYSIWEPRITGKTAEVTIGVGGLMWTIDQKMRLRILVDQVKGFITLRLVMTADHWRFDPEHRVLEKVSTAPEWRIEEEGDIWITVDTAIKYLEQVQESSSDPAIRKNAEESIAMLKRHRN